ncbi:HEAT repeat domain-containing protein [Streptomyces sp. NBC_01433]|uniref:HEAT repeat domain-containing protein n=1 Tax=Streptomyces sp. NBC_01433 TaxID=2903864 RepID=UPI00224F328A|nr:HEAT repeat domain-containing protein [Streptomyces sp. NBC_01433]MCX4678871.1 HEAT repeat domain-containing protein [Streptomyces sp. NBC_01433]
MTTPPDEQILDALGRADAGWLARHLDARVCPPAVLGRLVRHEDSRVRYLGLTLLAERVGSPCGTGDAAEPAQLAEPAEPAERGEPAQRGDSAELGELAALLSGLPAGSPEESLVLAGLHEHFGPRLPYGSRPDWRAARLPVRVRVAWLRAEVLTDPAAIRDETPGELLYQAVRGSDIMNAHRPAHLVAELVDTRNPVLQAEALRLARQGLHAGLLSPATARARLIPLLGAADADVAAGALGELAAPWAVMRPLDPALLAPGLTAESATGRPEVAAAALITAARHGHGRLLRQTAEDQDLPPALRRNALELLGDLAERDDISGLLAVATRDPLLLGGPVLTCLRGLHRRGHFPTPPDVRTVVGLALADHSVPSRDVATVLYTCRRAMLDALIDAPADDPSWPRRLDLLVALAGQGTGDLPIGAAVTGLLRAAPTPGPFLDAIRTLRHADAEEAVIALLPRAPAPALTALEAIGGRRTAEVLAEGLGLTVGEGLGAGEDAGAGADTRAATGTIAPAFRGVRGRALELLWHLSHDPESRRRILVRLDPTDLPARIAADLGGPDEAELALLSARPDPDEPVAALCRLADHGGAGTLPVIADLLLRIVRDLALPRDADPAAVRPRAARPTDERRPDTAGPTGEPEVPKEVVDAVHALGCRLHRRQRIRPVCLLDAADAQEAGHALVATTALDLLDRPALSGGEQAVLLKLLLQVPGAVPLRPRVHSLLRGRDPQVRKHVIALLARDAEGDDAQALSATLTVLTRARDIRTVRQALLALGHARARWASASIAACLDHPNMNIKKTAASVLVRAGAPAAVPRLLHWLGRHDNPGLRTALVEALRAILGDACTATVLAAAEQSEDGRARELLLAGLDNVLTPRAVLALDAQASPVVPALLGLLSSGGVRLASGSVAELAEPLSRHGITTRLARAPQPRDAAALAIESLLTGGWNTSVALRIAAHPAPPDADRLRELRRLRPMLEDWLGLAESVRSADARRRVLRCTLRLCPAPWTSGEVAAFARFGGIVTDAYDEVARGQRDAAVTGECASELMAVLDAVAPRLSAAERFTVAEAVRASPAGPSGSTSTLTLLRRCGAVLVRPDLDRALAAARLGADPWLSGPALLRETFGVPVRTSPSTGSTAWRAALDAAVRTPRALEEFRRRDHSLAPGSRDRLDALIDAYPGADPGVRERLVDWMTRLQPLDAPAWTITETAVPTREAAEPRTGTSASAVRSVHLDDLDQPRSTALRTRLLTLLDAPDADRRNAAAQALRAWPEPDISLAVLRAYLRGRVDDPATGNGFVTGTGIANGTGTGFGAGTGIANGTANDLGTRIDLARALVAVDGAELRGDAVRPERVLRLAARLDPWDLPPLVPLLLGWWESGPPDLRPEALRVLRGVPADVLATLLGERIDAGATGLLELLSGRPLLRTPALTRARRRLRTEGRDALADAVLLVEGPLRGPGAARADAAALEALRSPAPAPVAAVTPGAGPRPALPELLTLARTGTPEEIRRALALLAERHGDRAAGSDRNPPPRADRKPGPGSLGGGHPSLRDNGNQVLRGVIDALLRHPKTGVRLHAHRTSRALLDRSTYARQTMILLADPQPDVVRMAIRTLAHASWEPAVPALVGLLGHAQPAVRSAAREAIGRFGAAAVPALRHAAARARPDKRSRYTDVLDRLTGADDR